MDLHFLRDVIASPGPFATVYLDASHDTEDAARAAELRWRDRRGELVDQGADEATLAALDAAVAAADPAVGRAGRVLVARGGEVVLDRDLPQPPGRPTAVWSTLPHLVPLLLEQPEAVPAVVVRVDKTGGEVYTAGDGELPEQVDRVRGEQYPLHKVRGGGWAHLRMQHAVENSWLRNVKAVAERVDTEVARTAARVVVLAGEEQSRTALRKELGERAAAAAVEMEFTGGNQGPDLDELAAAVGGAVREVLDRRRQEVLEDFAQRTGRPDGQAVQGVTDVLAALRAEAVDTLLLDGGADRPHEVWISDAPTQVALDEEDLRAVGAEPTARVPVDAALLVAAAGGDARVVLADGEPEAGPLADGVGALLRYPLPAGA
jgi:hypothetical protein